MPTVWPLLEANQNQHRPFHEPFEAVNCTQVAYNKTDTVKNTATRRCWKQWLQERTQRLLERRIVPDPLLSVLKEVPSSSTQ
jgi:hypothetical protein